MTDPAFSIDVVPFGLARFGFVERDDGAFLALLGGWQGSISDDRGRTWSRPQPLIASDRAPFPAGKGNASIIRLASGRIGIQRMFPEGPDPLPGSISAGIDCLQRLFA